MMTENSVQGAFQDGQRPVSPSLQYAERIIPAESIP